MIRVLALKLISITVSLSVFADTARASSTYRLVDVNSRLNVRLPVASFVT